MAARSDEDVPSRVAITGGAGFIGRAVGARYRSLGAEVVAIDQRADDPDVVVGDTSAPGPWQDAVATAGGARSETET